MWLQRLFPRVVSLKLTGPIYPGLEKEFYKEIKLLSMYDVQYLALRINSTGGDMDTTRHIQEILLEYADRFQ